MNTGLPDSESRLRAQEYMTGILHARVEELNRDMTASFKQIVSYHVEIEAKMATKDDIAKLEAKTDAMEVRILDAFKQLMAMIDARLPPR